MKRGKIKNNVLKVTFGFTIGAINGLLGGGGGMLCVPFLENILGEEVKVSHATTVLVIFPVCIASSIVYILSGAAEAPAIYFVMAGTSLGGFLGGLALNAAPKKAVAAVFALIVVAAGVLSIWK